MENELLGDIFEAIQSVRWTEYRGEYPTLITVSFTAWVDIMHTATDRELRSGNALAAPELFGVPLQCNHKQEEPFVLVWAKR